MGHPLLELSNKTAVVIGGTSGIGLALVKALAQAGANVVPTGRRADLVRDAGAQVVFLATQDHLDGRVDRLDHTKADAVIAVRGDPHRDPVDHPNADRSRRTWCSPFREPVR